MSKSKGNLIAPSHYFDTVGADALRLYHLFAGPPTDDVDWTDQTDEVIEGCGRFLGRLWRIAQGALDTRGGRIVERDQTPEDEDVERATHRLMARVSDDYDRWSYNTAVAALMEFVNLLYRYVQSPQGARRQALDHAVDTVLLLMAPMTPHVTAELWERRHGDGAQVHAQSWPAPDPALLTVSSVTLVVQVNGKVRARLEVEPTITEADAVAAALADPKVAELVGAGGPRKVVARPPKLVNVVV
jgi:leucyl-tRNA synthetase